MLRHRIASTLVGIPVVLAATWIGGVPFFLLVLLLGMLALRELYLMGGLAQSDRLLGYAGHLVLFSIGYGYGSQALLVGLIFMFLIINVFWVMVFPRDFKMPAILIWGKLYITLLLSCFLWLRQQDNGFMLVAAVFITVWSSDTGAYLVGVTLGRHKLIPSVSPKKSVEGAVGGIVFAAVALVILAPSLGYGLLPAALLGILLSMVGQLGDLAESALKRWANVKDSGSFLPGHGGVLDRLDSLLFVAPLAWLFFVILR